MEGDRGTRRLPHPLISPTGQNKELRSPLTELQSWGGRKGTLGQCSASRGKKTAFSFSALNLGHPVVLGAPFQGWGRGASLTLPSQLYRAPPQPWAMPAGGAVTTQVTLGARLGAIAHDPEVAASFPSSSSSSLPHLPRPPFRRRLWAGLQGWERRLPQ